MIGIDTNVLLRLLIEDDGEQAALVRSAVRVLESGLRRSRSEISGYLQAILENDGLVIENRDSALKALSCYQDGSFDFSDAPIAADNLIHGCSTTMTFDRKAARLPEFQHLA